MASTVTVCEIMKCEIADRPGWWRLELFCGHLTEVKSKRRPRIGQILCVECSGEKRQMLKQSIADLDCEVSRARAKFPGNRFLLAALTEELGELAQAFLQKQGRDRIRKEALQVACVAMRIYEEGDPTFDDLKDEEAKL